MSISVGVSSAWKTVILPSVGVGGVWKTVNKAWVGVGGVWKLAYTSISFSGTLTEAGYGDEGGGNTLFGYQSGAGGSLSPDTDSNGKQIYRLHYDSNTDQTILSISSLSDLTQAYFTTLTVDASSLTSAAASYDYGVVLADASSWIWSGNTFGFDGSGSRAVVIS